MNINDYIGIPYVDRGREIKGCDCYGLVRILYKGFKNILLPEYKNIESDKAIHNSLILKERENWTEVYNPEFGDVVCFKIFGMVSHVGMMIDRDNFIHAWKGIDSAIETIKSIAWRHRTDGFFRYHC